MSAVWEICKDVLIDGARMIPFLLFAFLLIELVESIQERNETGF